MRIDDRELSSVSLEQYVDWVCTDKLYFDLKWLKDYSSLVYYLAEQEFVWLHPRDENRAIDGLDLRDDFSYETGLYLDGSSGLGPKCSVFEMLAALAIRIENQIMRDPDRGNRSGKWFEEILDNLGFLNCKNRSWNRRCEEIIDENLRIFMYRKYRNNKQILIFPLQKCRKSMKNEEIWKQCMTYLNENYYNDNPDLELFR